MQGWGWCGPGSPPPGVGGGGWSSALHRLLRSKPPTPDRLQRQAAAAGGARGGLRQPRGLAKPQVCYETLPVVETFLRDPAAPLAPLVPPVSPLTQPPSLLSPWVSGPNSFLSVSLSSPVSATSTGEQHFLLRLSLSGVQPWGPLKLS